VFGNPCKECYVNRARFSIQEIPAAKFTGKNEIENALEGSEMGTLMDGAYRIYVLDECLAPDTQVDTITNGVATKRVISRMQVGDKLKNAWGIDTVKNVSRKRISSAVLLRVGDRCILSSGRHPYFTRDGWKYAEQITAGDSIVGTDEAMRILWERDTHSQPSAEGTFLQQELLREISGGSTEKEDRHRGGWGQPSTQNSARGGSEKNSTIGFARVDSVEILQLGDPRLDKYRDEKGDIYFYDLEVARHPSFSVEGLLVHNCHKMSDGAQSLALKYLEDSPESAVFILCSTDPQKIIDTLRSRCQCYEVRGLSMDDTTVLVTKLLKIAKSDLPVDRLVDALVERRIIYPRLIANAVEKYVGGQTPSEAAEVEGIAEINTKALTRSVVKGDWEEASRYLLNAQPSDMRIIRVSILAYLRTVLLESPISDRTKVVANSIAGICSVHNAEDAVIAAAMNAELYKLTAMFSRYPL
jgi:DNA polymerase III gamma/tau subunit